MAPGRRCRRRGWIGQPVANPRLREMYSEIAGPRNVCYAVFASATIPGAIDDIGAAAPAKAAAAASEARCSRSAAARARATEVPKQFSISIGHASRILSKKIRAKS